MKKLILVLGFFLTASAFAAFSSTKTGDSVFGNLKVQFWDVTFVGATSGTFDTGLRDIKQASCNNEVSEGDGLVVTDSADGSATSLGDIYFSGFTASDIVTCMIVGR